MGEYIVFWEMFRPILLLAALLLRGTDKDVKMATWSVGKPDTDTYESLSFWIKDGHRAYIRYAHGKDEEESELTWLGPDTVNGRRGFRVSLPQSGACCLAIAPDSIGIQVVDRRKHSARSFFWEDGNPYGDSTTACTICAHNEKEAQGWLHKYFLR
jgi:hypothetical protein